MCCWWFWEAEEHRWCSISLRLGRQEHGKLKTAFKSQLSPFCCVTWDKSCVWYINYTLNDINLLGVAHLLDERPRFPYLKNWNGDPTCLSCWQPQGWM